MLEIRGLKVYMENSILVKQRGIFGFGFSYMHC